MIKSNVVNDRYDRLAEGIPPCGGVCLRGSMEGQKRMLSFVRRCVDDFSLIDDGDRIAVGVSGGKDSLTLCVTLAALRRFYPKKFSLGAIAVDMCFGDLGSGDGTDYSSIGTLCGEIGVPFTVVPSQIAKIIFDVRKEKNPCSLCSVMRKGALNDAAKTMGYNKVALGHNFDDLVETAMMNLLIQGHFDAFEPSAYLSRTGLTVIRPLLYAPEKDVRYFASKAGLPVMRSSCPANGNTEREYVKQLINDQNRRYDGVSHRIFLALKKSGWGSADGMPGIESE